MGQQRQLRIMIQTAYDSRGTTAAQKAMDNLTKSSGKSADATKKNTGAWDTFAGVVGGGVVLGALQSAGRALVNVAKQSIQLASDAEESASKFKYVFGDAASAVEKDLTEFADAAQRSTFQLKDMAAQVGAIIGPMMGSEQAAGRMSVEISKLATDLASFMNVAEDDALTALQAGLIGESEPMRRFGVLLSAARVEAEILGSGMAKTKSEITDAMQVQARFNLIMRDTATAQGDAERTGDSLANQQRGLAASVEELQILYGQDLMPIIQDTISGAFKPMVDSLLDIKRATNEARDSTADFIGLASDTKTFQAYQQQLNLIGRAADKLRLPNSNMDVRNAAIQLLADYGRVAETSREVEVRMKTLGAEISDTGVEINGLKFSWVELRREMERLNQVDVMARMQAEAEAADRNLSRYVRTTQAQRLAHLQALEPSHNYADSLYDMSNGANQAALSLIETKRRIANTIAANEEAAEANRANKDAMIEAAAAALEQQRAYESFTTSAFAQSLNDQVEAMRNGQTAAIDWKDRLFEVAMQGDLTAEQMRGLAGATGDFTDAQIEAALKAAAMETKIAELAEAIANNQITVGDAIEELDNFEAALDRNAEAGGTMATAIDGAKTKVENLKTSLDGIDGKVVSAKVDVKGIETGGAWWGNGGATTNNSTTNNNVNVNVKPGSNSSTGRETAAAVAEAMGAGAR